MVRPRRSRLPRVPPPNDQNHQVTVATSSQSLLGGTVQRTVLPSGLRVLTEQVPGVRSAAIGIWVGVGSRDESPAEAGASHYLEHLLFKGTPGRSALDISAALEAVGGELNAFTSREHTCYYARVLDRDLPLAVDVVSDMVTASLLREDDVEAERGVILEEIAMHEDDPADLVHDVFSSAALGDGPLGRPVLGTAASIATLNRSQIAEYYRIRYVPSATVVAVSGALDHAEALAAVVKAWDKLPSWAASRCRPGAARGGPTPAAGCASRGAAASRPTSSSGRPASPDTTSGVTPSGCCRAPSARA